jgi:cell pole-organizing protein PopZ
MGELNQDPSMEEILASIKRVIADDSRAAPPPARGAARPRLHVSDDPAPTHEPEVEEAVSEAQADEEDVLELSDPIREDDGLASSDATVAARQSLAALAAMRQAAPPPQQTGVAGDGPLEAIVREMLRPMLKDWLDNRLPEMVEEMVAREIARITGKSF